MKFDLKKFFEAVSKKKYHPRHFNSIITTAQYRLAYNITLKYLNSRCTVLDWGCGNGHFTHFLEYCKIKTYSYVFDFPASFNELSAINFTYGNINEPTLLPFKNKLFDAVFSVGVLEHVHEHHGSISGSIAEINRILKDNGLFICFHLPNKYGWLESLLKMIKGSHFGHSRRFSFKEIKNIIDSSGFVLIESGRYNFLPRNFFMKGVIPYERYIFPFYDLTDRLISIILNPFCQNYYFIARKSNYGK